MESSPLLPGLYIVPTPIGNLGDVTKRSVELLAAADVVAVEDSRVTGKLLHHLGLKKQMIPYHDHSKGADRERLLARMANEVVVLVSDAGTPLISDPGYKLVREARAAGYFVSALPGPCAATTALSMAGLPTDRFLFAGFLPSKEKAKADTIIELGAVKATLVFYESGPRLGATLKALAALLGAREAAVAREISKRFEEVVTGSLEDLAVRYQHEEPKGEIVLIVGPPGEDDTPPDAASLDDALRIALKTLPPAKAAKEVAKALRLDRHDVYARAMELKEETKQA